MSTNGEKKPDAEGFVTLHVPSRYSYLRIVRQSIVDMCARVAATEIEAAQLEMAVDEACANIIEHSYGGENEAEGQGTALGLRVNLMQYHKKVSVELYDFGKGFDFQSYAYPDPVEYVDNEQHRGLGMYIINQFVDEVEYTRGTPLGNCLKITKNIA